MSKIVAWIVLAQDSVLWWDCLNTIANLQFPLMRAVPLPVSGTRASVGLYVYIQKYTQATE
jgi:hypothetical protein